MDDELNPSESVPSDSASNELASLEGDENGSVSLKDVLSKALGRTFTSDEEALKSVKETYKYVGKAGQAIKTVDQLKVKLNKSESEIIKLMDNLTNPEAQAPQPQVDTSKFITREEYDDMQWFAENKDYSEHRDILLSLKKGTGKPLKEVVQLDSFKQIYEKAKAHDEVEKSKSVLHSNPRLGVVADKQAQAKQAVEKGDFQSANKSAVESVIDAWG